MFERKVQVKGAPEMVYHVSPPFTWWELKAIFVLLFGISSAILAGKRHLYAVSNFDIVLN